LSKQLKQTIMKKYLLELLEQVTPRNEEDKDALMCFLFAVPLFLSIIGALVLILILMR
jgi:hypothetical protein